jgi:hypothetical protein
VRLKLPKLPAQLDGLDLAALLGLAAIIVGIGQNRKAVNAGVTSGVSSHQ